MKQQTTNPYEKYYNRRLWLENEIKDQKNPLYTLFKQSRYLKFIMTQYERENNVELIPCKEIKSFYQRLKNYNELSSIKQHFNNTEENGYASITLLIENMIEVLHHTPRNNIKDIELTRNLDILFKDWPTDQKEIDEHDPILNFDVSNINLVMNVCDELKTCIENLLEDNGSFDKEGGNDNSKLIYYIKHYNEILSDIEDKNEENEEAIETRKVDKRQINEINESEEEIIVANSESSNASTVNASNTKRSKFSLRKKTDEKPKDLVSSNTRRRRRGRGAKK
ncbi:14555_t:CDS:2 [Funneliformis geosporum]|uniref:6062_t:CDS:1 n=1 Tax=Funneliformis geosporum TaxID=1117311 RepID=A0A9W4SQD6_9GLOM|nr:14555_t:CDS:2 [Funneliformis geosporum]CAI2178893.1 6062_t:CDS:2 [Funneliformis geosporum]